jgi:hypothetical protein
MFLLRSLSSATSCRRDRKWHQWAMVSTARNFYKARNNPLKGVIRVNAL